MAALSTPRPRCRSTPTGRRSSSARWATPPRSPWSSSSRCCSSCAWWRWWSVDGDGGCHKPDHGHHLAPQGGVRSSLYRGYCCGPGVGLPVVLPGLPVVDVADGRDRVAAPPVAAERPLGQLLPSVRLS